MHKTNASTVKRFPAGGPFVDASTFSAPSSHKSGVMPCMWKIARLIFIMNKLRNKQVFVQPFQ